MSSSAARAALPPSQRPDSSGSVADDGRLRFDRNELSGAFGDLGTSLPLLVAMILAAGLDAPSVLVMFGLMQVATGLAYRMPMPVQPLKAVAALVITQKVPAATLYGGGLAIGVTMLVLAATGLLGWLARVVPRAVVRGLQFGLGLQLSLLALRDMVPSGGMAGYALAAAAFALVLLLLGNRRWPPAPFVVALGVAWALWFAVRPGDLVAGIGFTLPAPRTVAWADIAAGFVVLALPQVPLSLGNSVLATQQLAADLFPDRPPLAVRRIGLTYAAMNLVAPWFGGVPTCHGSGGMAGHWAMGGRTGGSVVIYGAFWLVLGLFFGGAFATVVQVFPRPVLGVLLVVEGLTLLLLARDLAAPEFALAVLVGLVAATLPNGYLVAMVLGVALHPLVRRGRLPLGR
jgi:Molybdate transporter of MFS superfamily